MDFTAGAQAAHIAGSSASTQGSPEDISRTDWTPASWSTEPAAGTEFDNSSLFSDDQDILSTSDWPWVPLSLISEDDTNIEGDLTLIDRDIVGIGEQFTGYEALPRLVA